MTDLIDRANERADEFLHDALAARQRAREKLAATNEDLTPDCADCGEPIPTVRRQALPGCTRCIDCQAASEKAPL